MAKEKFKSLTLTKQKIADVEGEHRVTFVASTSNEDRDYEHVAIESFRLPLKGGGHIVVSDLPMEGSQDVDIPFLADHDLYEVDKVLGSVRRAWYENGALIFECGFSSRPYAQDKYTLLAEGHLDNAFSIQYRDYEHDATTNTDYGGEIVEVSLVTRGSNMDAQVLAVKAMKGKEVEEDKSTEAIKEAQAEETVVEESKTVESEAEAETPAEKTEEEATADAETESEEEEKNNNKEESEMNPEIAKSLVKEAEQTPVVATNNYLASKAALKDFKDTVLKFHRGSNEQIMKAWKDNLSAKAVAGDAILPTRIENIMFKSWADNPGILRHFRQLGVRNASVYAATATENGEAKGHIKGEAKVDQTLNLVRRDLKALAIYKKLPIDLQDLYDDETGELLAFRVKELADRIAHAVAVGAIFGDSTNVYLSSGRGLYPMAGDISAVSGYGTNVATTIANVATDDIITKCIKAAGAVKTENGEGKVLVVPEGTRTDIRLALINLNYPVANIEEFLGVSAMYEFAEMAGSGYDVIAFADQSYVLVGEASATVRTDFDLTYNQDVMLQERYVAGSAQGYKTVAGYAAAEEPSA